MKFVVIDDDPTGSQTVHDCLLLLKWDCSTLAKGFESKSNLFFILANTRSLSPNDAKLIIEEICKNLKTVMTSQAYKEEIIFISRGDSTLRGHNFLEFEITIYNKTDFAMPINFGLHPYFNVSDFKNLEFVDNPLNCQDQERNIISNTLDELNKINLGVDLLMYTSGRSSFRDKIFKREVTLNHPYPFDLGVIWSDPPRRMICLEPWTSPRNSFVDGFRKIMIPSNDSKRLNASIQIKSLK